MNTTAPTIALQLCTISSAMTKMMLACRSCITPSEYVPLRILDYKIGDNRIDELINDAALYIEASYR
ncbi:hypothetical protein IFO70_19430 [Phormidium tenue FACHB-886]|nr:hypothetical protein [Phormidium tenue FACHB-886]